MNSTNAGPFLKWAGGKRQLLSQFKELYPVRLGENKIKKYVEPFIGGGAVFFELSKRYKFEEIVLNDINEEVILTYKVVRDAVEDLIDRLGKLEESFLSLEPDKREELFYSIREKFNSEKTIINYDEFGDESITHAMHFIFLNKTCFNGLYRQNKKGAFNVPFGKYKNPTICDEDNLRNVSRVLENVHLICGDFEGVTEYIDQDTFVYLDPPYRPLDATSHFNAYSKTEFNDDSQIRLSRWFRLLSEKNADLMLSNSNPKNTDGDDDFFEKIYEGFDIQEVYASRNINSKGEKRGAISELVIRYEHK